MKKGTPIISVLLFISFFLAACTGSSKSMGSHHGRYAPVSRELYDTIVHLDSVLFNAFNNRDLDKLKSLFTDDLEFYHDKGGLTNYRQNIDAFKNLFDKNNGLKRELIAGSLEVYPLPDYGAVQTGLHRFCHTENGQPDCGTFKFVHIWKKRDGAWKISRVISYDH
jgi:ketosteroid isomerase-like protein